jgi:hypothetical protein
MMPINTWLGQPVYYGNKGRPYIKVSLLDMLGCTELGAHIKAAKMGLREGEYTIEKMDHPEEKWYMFTGLSIGLLVVVGIVIVGYIFG